MTREEMQRQQNLKCINVISNHMLVDYWYPIKRIYTSKSRKSQIWKYVNRLTEQTIYAYVVKDIIVAVGYEFYNRIEAFVFNEFFDVPYNAEVIRFIKLLQRTKKTIIYTYKEID